MKKAMNKAAQQYEKVMGCTIEETAIGFTGVFGGAFIIWLAAVLQGGAA